MYRKIEEPKLTPRSDYKFLLFQREYRSDVVEVVLPDGGSYCVDVDELRNFLRLCKIECYDLLVDFIWNCHKSIWDGERYHGADDEEDIEEVYKNLIYPELNNETKGKIRV